MACLSELEFLQLLTFPGTSNLRLDLKTPILNSSSLLGFAVIIIIKPRKIIVAAEFK